MAGSGLRSGDGGISTAEGRPTGDSDVVLRVDIGTLPGDGMHRLGELGCPVTSPKESVAEIFRSLKLLLRNDSRPSPTGASSGRSAGGSPAALAGGSGIVPHRFL
eukprot:scaffold16925_cov180-Isochrysis_galbana.AAC.2